MKGRKIYVASSWRNEMQQDIVRRLRTWGHKVYDFKNPREGDRGFHWSEIDPEWENWTPDQFRAKLNHPLAASGFASDFKAMEWADTCVYVLPCGRSASLEAGWFIGSGRLSICLLADGEPELMFKMFDHVCISLAGILDVLDGCQR